MLYNILTTGGDVFRTLSNIWDRAFCKTSSIIFRKNSILDVAVFIYDHNISRAKLNFPVYIFPKQKSYKGQNISQYINILRAREHLKLYYQYQLCSFLFVLWI